MKKLSVIFILIVVIALISSTIVMAETGYIKMGSEMMWGKPHFYTDCEIAYYVWRSENAVHIRWTADGDGHLFRGAIHSDVPIYNIVGVRSEIDDYIVRVSQREIAFSATTSCDVDGFSFQVDDASEIRLTLKVDGCLIEPSQIYMGKDEAHPTGNPIVFYRP